MHWIMSGVEKMGKTPPSAWPRAAQDIGVMDPVEDEPEEAEAAASEAPAEKVPAAAGSAAE
jgi:hypothetical protein